MDQICLVILFIMSLSFTNSALGKIIIFFRKFQLIPIKYLFVEKTFRKFANHGIRDVLNQGHLIDSVDYNRVIKDCFSVCNKNEDCSIITLKENKSCLFYKSSATFYLTESNGSILYQKSLNQFK